MTMQIKPAEGGNMFSVLQNSEDSDDSEDSEVSQDQLLIEYPVSLQQNLYKDHLELKKNVHTQKKRKKRKKRTPLCSEYLGFGTYVKQNKGEEDSDKDLEFKFSNTYKYLENSPDILYEENYLVQRDFKASKTLRRIKKDKDNDKLYTLSSIDKELFNIKPLSSDGIIYLQNHYNKIDVCEKLRLIELGDENGDEDENVKNNMSRVQINNLFEIYSSLDNVVNYKHSLKLQDKFYNINPELMNFSFFDNLNEHDKKQLLLNIERSIIGTYTSIDVNYYHGKIEEIRSIIINKIKQNHPLLSKLLFLKSHYNNLDNMLIYNNKRIYYTILTMLYYDTVSKETIKFLKDKEYDNEYLVIILENNKHIPYLYEFLIYYRKIALYEMRFNMKNKKLIHNRILNKKYDRFIDENRLIGYTDADQKSKFYGIPSNQIYYNEIYTRYKPTVYHRNFCQPKINEVWKKANLKFISSESTYYCEYILKTIEDNKKENIGLISKNDATRKELQQIANNLTENIEVIKQEQKLAMDQQTKEIEQKLAMDQQTKEIEQKLAMNKQTKEIEKQKLAMDQQTKEIEKQKLAMNQQTKEIEKQKLAMEQQKLAMEQQKLAMEQQKAFEKQRQEELEKRQIELEMEQQKALEKRQMELEIEQQKAFEKQSQEAIEKRQRELEIEQQNTIDKQRQEELEKRQMELEQRQEKVETKIAPIEEDLGIFSFFKLCCKKK